MRHDDIKTGVTYVGKGAGRMTRTVLVIGSAEECLVPPENIRFLKPGAVFVRYRCIDNTVTWEALVSFAQWAAAAEAGWPRTSKDGRYTVGVEGAEISLLGGPLSLSAEGAIELAQVMREAAREVQTRVAAQPRGESL